MQIDLNKTRSAVLVGGGHGIGLALTKEILGQYPQIKLYASYRRKEQAHELFECAARHPQLNIFQADSSEELELIRFRKFIETKESQLDLILSTVGVLHDDETSPEKSLDDVHIGNLQKLFLVNACSTLLLAKTFFPLLKRSPLSVFAALSARVGSIEDNRMGGWYSYRASKAAQNMFLKNISLEFTRRSCRSKVLSIHPGTTRTSLSEPFLKSTKYKIHSPEESAKNILKVINQQTLENEAMFFDWEGKEIPW